MLFLQLLVVGLAWHLFGLPNERTVIDKIVAGEFNQEASILAITAGGIVVAFMVQRVIRNRGPYHVNQFRIYFTTKDTDVTPAILSRNLENNFHKAFANNRVARVCRPFSDRPEIIRFTLVLRLARLFQWAMGKERQEHVELLRPHSSDAAFHAYTLRIAEASAADWHFLSGTRSWCIAKTEDFDNYGEPVPLAEAFFLETAALEEFSFWTYKTVRRKHIERTWRDFLVDALMQINATASPITCRESGSSTKYKLGSRMWRKKRRRKWMKSGPEIEIWQRESAYGKKRIGLLQAEDYASRLFTLHLGIKRDYDWLVK